MLRQEVLQAKPILNTIAKATIPLIMQKEKKTLFKCNRSESRPISDAEYLNSTLNLTYYNILSQDQELVCGMTTDR